MTITCWYMDSVDSDQREPHKDTVAREVTKKDLDALGVLSWEGLTGVDDPRLDEIKKERGYTYSDLIEVCPHKEEDRCDCRKPKPGMIISASKELNININCSYMIGDRWTDILCGQRAGCKENFYIDNNYSEKKPDKPFTHVPSLLHCVRKILAINDDVNKI